jgi:DNA-binding transcriptional MerR regulator
MSALDTLLATGLTYRQLDHWARQGWIRPHHTGGTGHRREWPTHELAIAALMKRLIDAGLAAAKAAETARDAETIRSLYDLSRDDSVTVEIADGLTLTISPATQQTAA